MRCACIDIGSNTTRLLVAEPGAAADLHEVLALRAFTRLGAGRAPGDEIPAAKVEEVASVVAELAARAAAAGAERVRAVATAALRDAPNGDALCAEVARRAGVRVDVLTGEEEAALAFAGAAGSVADPPDALVGVVDVGGGSTELVTGTPGGGVTWSASFKVGSGMLADVHLRSDPPAAAELERLRAHAAGTFAGLDAPRPAAAYAVGGSATSLRRLLGPVLDRATLAEGLRLVSGLPVAEVAQRFGLHPERARLLPAGLVLLDAAAAAFGAPLCICGGGLREGVVRAELARGTVEADGQGT